MGKHWSTCSGLDRLFKCAASAALPQSRDSSVASEKGRGHHSKLELASGGAEFVDMPDGYRVQTSSLRLPQNPQAEIAYGYDVVSDEVFRWGYVGERNYPETPYSVLAGTMDVEGVSEVEVNGKVLKSADVVDFKTGFSDYPSDSWQLRALAFMAWRHHKADIARTRITYVRSGIVTHVPSRWWTAAEMEETGRLLRRKYDEVNKLARKGEIDVSDVHRSGQCHFCPAFSSCPYMRNILKGGNLGHLDTRDLRDAYFNWQAVRSANDRMEEAMKVAASNGPIDLGDGLWYGLRNGKFKKYRENE